VHVYIPEVKRQRDTAARGAECKKRRVEFRKRSYVYRYLDLDIET